MLDLLLNLSPKTVIGVVAGVIAFTAYIVYIVSILKGESRPNRTTWWIWTCMGLVLALSYYFSGAVTTIWVPLVEFIGPLLIGLLSLKYGEGGLRDKTDLFCLTGALISVVLWVIFDSPIVALVTNLVIDAFALIPTLKKSYARPEGENFWAWFGTLSADALNLFAIDRFVFAVILYPVYMLTCDLLIVGVLLVRKIKKGFNHTKYRLTN